MRHTRNSAPGLPPTLPTVVGVFGAGGRGAEDSTSWQVEAEKPQAGFQLRLCSRQLRGIRHSVAT